MADFDLISSERLFARIEDELSTYQANNILDVDRFYTQVKWFMQQLGRAVEPFKETIIKLENYKQELPCDFYSLDSAWLCDSNGSSFQWNLQDTWVAYTDTTCETVSTNGVPSISACNSEQILDKTTIKEYISTTNPGVFRWNSPRLMYLNPKKSVENICSEDCKNLFVNSPYEISIKKQGNTFTLFSTLEKPVIYIKYYAYPIDEETKLPLIPDHSVFEEAIFYHCITYFLRMAWLNKMVVDVERQLQYFEKLSMEKYVEAKRLSKFPSFNKMVQLGKRSRNKFSSYEAMNNKHY